MVSSQSLPIDFENGITTSNFIDFDGGEAMVVANPQSGGINNSATVAQIVRTGGEIWAGSKIELTNNLDFSVNNVLSMKVFTTAPIGTVVKFKLEGAGATERDVRTTVSNEWETLQWDFTGVSPDFNSIVFMFDFGIVGDGSANSTFLFDDVEQLFGGRQIDFPVTFEESGVNYTMSDFGGNVSVLTTDPMDANNHVVEVVKTIAAATWAGTTIGTPAGFATNLPLNLSDSKMTVKVWAPEVGMPIRLKVEDSNDPTHTCETETKTTVAQAWETIEFDFTNQAPGTELLSIGLDRGWIYNMASIFFNFGTEGEERTYYFDDVNFGELVPVFDQNQAESLEVFPNPTKDQWSISSERYSINFIEVFDLQGKLILKMKPQNHTATIDGAVLPKGVYFSKITTDTGAFNLKLIKE